MQMFAEVAVGLPISKTFHYAVPENLTGSLQIGMRVLVPFNGRKITAFTLDLVASLPEGIESKLQEIEGLLDDLPLIDSKMLRFYRWISEYYLCPLGEVIKTGLPPGLHLGSQPLVTLTGSGRNALETGRLNKQEKAVFAEIDTQEAVPLKALLRQFPGEITKEKVLAWRKQGLLEIKNEILTRQVTPKWEKVYRCENGHPGPKLSKKRAEILDWIRPRGIASSAELNHQFRRPADAIRFLLDSGLITVSKRESPRNGSLQSDLKSYPRPNLTRDQEAVLAAVAEGIASQKYAPFLLHGVTGSGKTEIYLRAIEKVLSMDRQAILLVPEISLTPQVLSRFRDRFGDNLALLHSGLGRGERYDQWRKILRGDVSIGIGARSAIFAPFRNLGIIIVDEEQDPSYKQDEKLKYNARDLAVVRAKQSEATLLLGSATPSLESYYNARKGTFRLLQLPVRIEGKPLPKVEVIDARKESDLFPERVRRAIQKNAENKKQALLFLNRRGYANFILCPDCGFTFKCPNCSVTLTYHLEGPSLHCHYCDYRVEAPADCPRCQGYRLRRMGLGTEKLEQEIKSLFPGLRVERMDHDTTTRRQSHHQILKRLEAGQIDVLVGTQMIVKGHDFPNVTFVGVVAADLSLHFPDFRSSERTFQLLTQVAGRAGRGAHEGEVVIQTFNPDHYSILRAKEHDFEGFYDEEIRFRNELGYPPFSRLINFRLSGNSEPKTAKTAEEMGRLGQLLLRKGYGKGIEIFGPSTAPFAKMRGKFRFQMLAKSRASRLLHQFARELEARMQEHTRGKGVNLDIDVDPVFIL
jgi:primosomal protein N' (replication factor Y) (superfamily II helicase)